MHRLKFFRITSEGEDHMFVLAPSPDGALAVWSGILRLSLGQKRTCRVEDAMPLLTEEQRNALEPFLEFGPAGPYRWSGEHWW